MKSPMGSRAKPSPPKPTVHAIHLCFVPGESMKALKEVLLLPNFGLQGDAMAGVGKERQLIISRYEKLHQLKISPGRLGDQITLRGIVVDKLPKGTKLDVGEAIVELVALFEPTDDLRLTPEQMEGLYGRGAMWAIVIRGGPVRVGDRVNIRIDE